MAIIVLCSSGLLNYFPFLNHLCAFKTLIKIKSIPYLFTLVWSNLDNLDKIVNTNKGCYWFVWYAQRCLSWNDIYRYRIAKLSQGWRLNICERLCIQMNNPKNNYWPSLFLSKNENASLSSQINSADNWNDDMLLFFFFFSLFITHLDKMGHFQI